MKTIGRLELVAFPDLNLRGLVAKIDTGAYTSALHCSQVEEVEHEGKTMLRAQILDPSHEEMFQEPVYFQRYAHQSVKSSNGQRELRFKVKTRIQIGAHIYMAEFTLTDRSSMRFPVLLGRKVLVGRFLVDVSHTYLLSMNRQPAAE